MAEISMSALQDEQLDSVEDQQQAEIALAEDSRQKLRVQQEQQEQVGVAGQVAQQVVKQGKQMVKQQVKKKIIHQALMWLAAILFNPYTWLIIGLILVAFLLGWCSEEKCQCFNAFGQVFFDGVVRKVFNITAEVVCGN